MGFLVWGKIDSVFIRCHPALFLRPPQQVETARVTATPNKNIITWLETLDISRGIFMKMTGVLCSNPEHLPIRDKCSISAGCAFSKVSCICGGLPSNRSLICT